MIIFDGNAVGGLTITPNRVIVDAGNARVQVDLNLDLRATAGAKPAIHVSVLRELTEGDKAFLSQQPAVVRAGTSLRRLRDSHHKVAKLLADGLSYAEVSMMTSYSLSRVYVLATDPMFRELISFYRENKDKEYTDFHATMASFATDAVQELHQRLDEDPDKMSNEFLADVVKTLADRTGHAPVSKSVNINVHQNLADRLSRARQRVASLPGTVEEATVVEYLPPVKESVV